MSDHPDVYQWIADKRMNRYILPPLVTEADRKERNKAVRAVGFLEGMSAWLWTKVGPDLADEAVVEFEKCVADIAEYIGLPPREVDAK